MRTDILSTIWKRSPGRYVFLPSKDPLSGQWYEPASLLVHHAEDVITDMPQPEYHGLDLYFSPGTYLEPNAGRKEENHAEMGVLYADLDDGFNRDRLKSLPPQLLMETSHGMYQAVWLLSEPLAVSAAKTLNKRLSYYMEADFGSWIITKVLRIPNSMNWKRGGQKVEVVRWDPDTVWTPDFLGEALPPLPQPSALSIDYPHPPLPTSEESRDTLHRLWDRLDHKTKAALTVWHPTDRSLHLSRLAKRMVACNLTPEEIFVVLFNLPANKFRSRPEVLWSSVVLSAFEL